MKHWRKQLEAWIESDRVQHTIVGIIIFNAIILGLETSEFLMTRFENIFFWLDLIIPVVFVGELALKLIAVDIRFFKQSWNIFDFIIILISILPDAGPLRILRTLRILRLLRIVRKLPKLRILIEAVLKSLPSLNWVSILLLLILYIWGLMGTLLYGKDFDEWFGNLGRSMYTLFQVMTLESWSMGIARPVMDKYPYSWIYFLSFIMIATYTSINIFIAIMVNTMQNLALSKEEFNSQEQPHSEAANLLKLPETEAKVLDELEKIKEQLAEIQKKLDNNQRC